jgi:hypothetical protein
MADWVRRTCETEVVSLAGEYPVVTLTGPRQAGKTTLCRMAFGDLPYANLEHPETRAYAADDPNGFLANYPNGAILDDLQRVPQLTSYIQVRVDEPGFDGTFILTGSQNFVVRDTVSQSLAGRTALVELLPFSCGEVTAFQKSIDTDELLYKGCYPRIWSRGVTPSRSRPHGNGCRFSRRATWCFDCRHSFKTFPSDL